PGLVEQFLVPGVSTTRAQERDHHKRENARRRRGARHPQHGGGGVRRLRPTSLVELEPCPRREQVRAAELQPPLAPVRNSLVEVPRRICVAMLVDGNGSERNVVVGDQVGETCLPSVFLSSLEPRRPVERGQHPIGIDRDLVVSEGLGNRKRSSSPFAALVAASTAGTEKRSLGIGGGELATGRQELEDVDGFPSAVLRLRDPARTPEKLGQPAQVVALFQLVAEAAAKLNRLLQCRNPLVVLVGVVARAGAELEELGSL